jgi:hypothetical protein
MTAHEIVAAMRVFWAMALCASVNSCHRIPSGNFARKYQTCRKCRNSNEFHAEGQGFRRLAAARSSSFVERLWDFGLELAFLIDRRASKGLRLAIREGKLNGSGQLDRQSTVGSIRTGKEKA